MRKVLLGFLFLVILAGIVIATRINYNRMLVEREQLKIDPSICEKCNKLEEFYVYENGKWVKMSQPLLWWMCADVSGKVHFSESTGDYWSTAGAAISIRRAKDISHGGVFIDGNRGILYVYVNNEEEGKKVLEKVNGSCKVVLLKGKYTYDQLLKWKRVLTNTLSNSDIGWSATGVDDTMNKVFIGLKKVDKKRLKGIERILRELGIPLDAVMVKEMIIKTLQLRTNRISPPIGGIQIENSDEGSILHTWFRCN